MPRLLLRVTSCFAGWPHRPPPRAERVPGAPLGLPENLESGLCFVRFVQGERGFRIESF